MTQAELVKLIEDTAGGQVAKALQTIQERQKDLAPRIVGAREDVEGQNGEAVINRSLAGVQKGIGIGGAILCLAEARGDLDRAITIAQKGGWKGMPEVAKTLTAGEATQGGVLIAPEHSQELIDLLAPRTVVRRHVADVIDVGQGSVDMPRMTADASTSWGGEIEAVREGNPAFDQLVMREFQQKTLVPVSNTLIRRGGGDRVATMVRNSTLRAMALGEDVVFLTSPGSEHRPKGLRYWVPASNVVTAQSYSLTNVNEDLGAVLLKLEEANVPMTSPVWFFAPRTKQALMTLQTTTGAYAFRDEMIRGTLWGFPFEATTHIVRNEGVASDESRIFLADTDELMLGQGVSLQIDLSSEATFVDADGNVVSAFQRNLTLLRVINGVDLKPKHVEAIAMIEAVKWAPAA